MGSSLSLTLPIQVVGQIQTCQWGDIPWVGCGKNNQMPVVEAFSRIRVLFMTNSYPFGWRIRQQKRHGQSRQKIDSFYEGHFEHAMQMLSRPYEVIRYSSILSSPPTHGAQTWCNRCRDRANRLEPSKSSPAQRYAFRRTYAINATQWISITPLFRTRSLCLPSVGIEV